MFIFVVDMVVSGSLEVSGSVCTVVLHVVFLNDRTCWSVAL